MILCSLFLFFASLHSDVMLQEDSAEQADVNRVHACHASFKVWTCRGSRGILHACNALVTSHHTAYVLGLDWRRGKLAD